LQRSALHDAAYLWEEVSLERNLAGVDLLVEVVSPVGGEGARRVGSITEPSMVVSTHGNTPHIGANTC
jgi:hypothetical protein